MAEAIESVGRGTVEAKEKDRQNGTCDTRTAIITINVEAPMK